MKKRVEKVRQQFGAFGITSFVTTKRSHIRYLTGVNISRDGDGIVLVLQDGTFLITDFRYQEDALGRAKKSGCYQVVIFDTTKGLHDAIAEILQSQTNIGFDFDLTYRQFFTLNNALNKSYPPPTVKNPRDCNRSTS